VISISKTGEVRYGIAVTEPGAAPVEESIKTKQDLTSDIYWLEVPRSSHICRHVNTDACD
jgi:type IV pilus assembly protein PilY1